MKMEASKPHNVEKKLRKIEKRLVDILKNFGYLKGRSSKTSEITAYLYVYQEVTQKMLRELTGYSLGTISTALRALENRGHARRHRHPHTREYHYELNGTLLQITSRSFPDIQRYFSQMKEFFEGIEAKLSRPHMSEKRGYENVRRFLDEMNVLIPAYEHALQEIRTMVLNIKQDAR